MSVIEAPKQEPPTKTRVEAPAKTRVAAYRRGRSSRVWHWTAGTGMALAVLATMHIVAQHFIVHQRGGLRTYAEVLSYISNPVIFVLEAAFLVAVTIHAMLGVRGVLYDRDPSVKTRRRIDRGLWIVGTSTVAYGMALLVTLVVRG
jgi:succinate dehydrogenase hydrophobic anchor subunit